MRLEDVREAAWWWMIEYNEQRPHDSLDGLTPIEYRQKRVRILLLQCLLDGNLR